VRSIPLAESGGDAGCQSAASRTKGDEKSICVTGGSGLYTATFVVAGVASASHGMALRTGPACIRIVNRSLFEIHHLQFVTAIDRAWQRLAVESLLAICRTTLCVVGSLEDFHLTLRRPRRLCTRCWAT
jgi:hypothetical protein